MNNGTGTDVHNPAVAEVRQPVRKLVGHVTAKVILGKLRWKKARQSSKAHPEGWHIVSKICRGQMDCLRANQQGHNAKGHRGLQILTDLGVRWNGV